MYTFSDKQLSTPKDFVTYILSLFFRPAVRKVASIGKYYNVKSQHSDSVFFMYVGDDDPHEELFVRITKWCHIFNYIFYLYVFVLNVTHNGLSSDLLCWEISVKGSK